MPLLNASSSGMEDSAIAAKDAVLVSVCSPRKTALLSKTATRTITKFRNRAAREEEEVGEEEGDEELGGGLVAMSDRMKEFSRI